MSRSYKKHPVSSAPSRKLDKRLANRCLRSRSKQTLRVAVQEEDEDYLPPLLRERSNVWSFVGDGMKHYNSWAQQTVYLSNRYHRLLWLHFRPSFGTSYAYDIVTQFLMWRKEYVHK